jgi:putative hydrolase of the HAD superfamily
MVEHNADTLVPSPVRAVFCGIGGAVYPDENYVAAVLRSLDELRAADGAGPADRAVVREVYNRIRARQGGSLVAALAAEVLGDPARHSDLRHGITRHWGHPPGTVYSDAVPFFAALAGRVTVGVLADQEQPVVDALHRDGLGRYIDVWGIPAVVGFARSTPALLTWCLDRAGVDAPAAVFVGTRLDTDVRPAHRLGLRTVWVLRRGAPDNPTPGQLAEADIVVRSLEALASRLLSPDPFGPR